jgi:hypothetical protein
MNKKKIKIAVFILIAALLFFNCHCFFHGFEREDGYCLLCEALAAGFIHTEPYKLILFFLFLTCISQFTSFQYMNVSGLQLQLRAPPTLSKF